jgi:hypothetical protein
MVRGVVLTWVVPYLISPTAANLGVKTAYLFAGLLVPTFAGIYFFYPEVRWALKHKHNHTLHPPPATRSPVVATPATDVIY